MATLTPAAIAAEIDAECASITIFVLTTASGGTAMPASAASSTPRGAISVGTRYVPRSSIISIASSSR